MLTKIHQLLIRPGATAKIYCKDGLSSTSVYNIDHLFNFGGNLKFVHCGAANINAATEFAAESMRWFIVNMDDKKYNFMENNFTKLCESFLDDEN